MNRAFDEYNVNPEYGFANIELLKNAYYYNNPNNITPYITQSWLNYTETNQYHHKHQHPNSLVSGVFYINCDDKFDKIKFFNQILN